jgi:hypothetical protein
MPKPNLKCKVPLHLLRLYKAIAALTNQAENAQRKLLNTKHVAWI